MNKIKNINFAEFRAKEKISYFKLISSVLSESNLESLEKVKTLLNDALTNYDAVDIKYELLFNNWKNAASIAAVADQERRKIYSSLYKVIETMSSHCSDDKLKACYAQIKKCFHEGYVGLETQSAVSGYIDILLNRVSNLTEAIENCKLTDRFKQLTDAQNDFTAKIISRNKAHAEMSKGIKGEAVEACKEAYIAAKTQIEVMQYATGDAEYTQLYNQIEKTVEAFVLKIALKRTSEKKEEQTESIATE